MTHFPSSYATLHPEAAPERHGSPTGTSTTGRETAPTTFSSAPSTSQVRSVLDASFEVRLAEIVREACDPTRQAVEKMQNQLRRLESTVRSCERSLADFRRTTGDVQRSHAAAFVQQYAPPQCALGRGASIMPPLVDDVGTLYFADGVVVPTTPTSAPPSSSREPVDAEDDVEYADLTTLVDGAGEPSSAAVEKDESSLTASLDSCAWPRDVTVMASSLDPTRFFATNAFAASTQGEAGEAAVEPAHGPPSAGSSVGVARHGLFAAWSSVGLRRSLSPSEDAVAAAAELEVRRLEVKLLRMQLLLTKKQLEQLTEDAEDLDKLQSFG